LGKYTLIVTEKPDAASRIAIALDNLGKPKRFMEKGVPYYEVQREKRIVVVPAIGHLYTVTSDVKGHGRYPVFGFRWVPRHEAEKEAKRTKVWLQVISKLAKEADVFIDACDYDIEGSIIGYCILKYACYSRENQAKRMRYSTLTKEELEKSYDAVLPHLDFELIEAGLARHEIDWLYGINLSRALTYSVKKTSGKYALLSTGRVQGPTLKFLATRERNIGCFVPVPYWSIKAKIKINNLIFEAEYKEKIIEVKREAESIVDACKQKLGIIAGVEQKKFNQPPPVPFDLGALQAEAYRFFGYAPIRTLSIAQRLYLNALISYPRTSSQKLPPKIGYESILKNLAKMREYTKLAGELLSKPELKPNEGPKQDPAHPAIYPTGKLPDKQLLGPEKNIWNLIVRRFLAVFGEPAIRQIVKATIIIDGEQFFIGGRQTLEEGWLHFYEPFIRLQEAPLPVLHEGQMVKVEKIILEDKFSKPPARFNPSSLLKKMEQGNIGTKATRAGIIQTLYDREYIHEERITVSDLGFEVIDVLRKHCPSVVAIDFTRQLEEKMSQIQQGNEKREKIIQEAIEVLKIVTTNLKDKEQEIGEQLSRAVNRTKKSDKKIGPCPTCKNGTLLIVQSKKTKKRFVGCTNYFKGICKTAFPLPQRGVAHPSDKPCKECGWNTVQILNKGKSPLNLCLNPQCSLKPKERKS
jgi:DNA topoisomerase-1